MTHSSLVQSFCSILMSVIRCHLAPIMHVLLLRHRVLKTGAEQLARMFRVSPQALFLHKHCVSPQALCFSSFPEDFKHSPCTTRTCGSSTNDLRPVAPTAAVITVCQGVVLFKLKQLMKDYIDLYRRNWSTDDAVICVLQKVYSLSEETDSSVRLIFFGSPMQHHLLVQKL